MKPKNQVVGLSSLALRSSMPKMVSTPVAAHKKRVFTEDEYRFLLSLDTEDLWRRVFQGDMLIKLLGSPAMLNMTPKKAAETSSNLRFQQEEIRKIIQKRSSNDG